MYMYVCMYGKQALRQLPTIIADNGGYDSSELITQLRAAHAKYV